MLLRTLSTFFFVLVLALAPVASAWDVRPEPPAPAPPATESWVLAFATPISGDAAATAQAAIACALGDITGDGVPDLVVQVADAAQGVRRLQALAGPDFQAVVWQQATTLSRVLQCAPDLDLDGLLDPIVRTIGQAESLAAGAPAAGESAQQVFQVLDGATGLALVGRSHLDTVTGATGPAVGAAQTATAALLPAAGGATAFLQTEVSQVLVTLPGGIPLPVPGVTATAQAAVHLQILDATGAVVTSIDLDEPGELPLAVAPIPLSGTLPDVAALTAMAAPVQEVAAQVPELALYAADGSLSWATQLPAAAGVPVLVPRAGDLDLDGIGDLIVTTVEQGVEAAPGAAYAVLSGVDGRILFEAAPVDGMLALLPLGQLPGGAALLQAEQLEGATAIVLSALDGAGQVLWSLPVDALATPVNAALDPFTGDLLGFTDLTGDGLPDIAVAARTAGGLALQAIDGATGTVAWNITVDGATEVVPVVVQGVASGVAAARSGAEGALLAIGTSSTEVVLTLLDSATGAVEWTGTAAVSSSTPVGNVSAQAVGDVDGDGEQDLLVTADFSGGGEASGSVAVVSGLTGETVWANVTDPMRSGAELSFQSEAGPASRAGLESVAEEGGEKGSPGLGMAAAALALVVAFAFRRRAR